MSAAIIRAMRWSDFAKPLLGNFAPSIVVRAAVRISLAQTVASSALRRRKSIAVSLDASPGSRRRLRWCFLLDWSAGWKILQEDALHFLKNWAAQAHALGWETIDIFGVHGAAPHARLDGMGLVPLLNGRPVAAITADSAIISSQAGHTHVFHKPRCRPRGCVPLWDARLR